jgi:hypothetical protein
MKHGDINNQQSPHDVHEEIAPNSDKAVYSSPVLTIYGSVSRLTMGGGATLVDGAMTTMMSDRNIKENIVRVGEHSLGIGLYLFDYKPEFREEWGFGRQFGVMADEVETVMPQAVSIHPDGYKMVNHAMLGISLTIH